MALRDKQSVDFALSFLAKDSCDFEQSPSNGQGLEDLWSVIDSLLTVLSKIVSGACQNNPKVKNNLDP